jgi:hypothetical protein
MLIRVNSNIVILLPGMDGVKFVYAGAITL